MQKLYAPPPTNQTRRVPSAYALADEGADSQPSAPGRGLWWCAPAYQRWCADGGGWGSFGQLHPGPCIVSKREPMLLAYAYM